MNSMENENAQATETSKIPFQSLVPIISTLKT